jgi:hypothetical protein
VEPREHQWGDHQSASRRLNKAFNTVERNMSAAASGNLALPAYLAILRPWVGITPCPLQNLAGCFHITLVTGLKLLDRSCYHFIVG